MSDLIKLQSDAFAQIKETSAGVTVTIRSLDGTALALVWIETRKDNDVIVAYTGDGITDEIPQHTEVGVTRVPLVHSIARAIKYAENSHTEDVTELGGHITEQPRLV